MYTHMHEHVSVDTCIYKRTHTHTHTDFTTHLGVSAHTHMDNFFATNFLSLSFTCVLFFVRNNLKTSFNA